MGAEDIEPVSLVVFTCERREHLLHRTVQSFYQHCDYPFTKKVMAIDGPIDPETITLVAPDIIVQHFKRSGYVHSIIKALKIIDTEYFFWLEDDWGFKAPVNIPYMLQQLKQHSNAAQVILSKYGALSDEFKTLPIAKDLYESVFGFSANPCLCKTSLIREAFDLLATAPKGDTLGEDGFENFLTRSFNKKNISCFIIDPVDHMPITHEGYLESTPRSWHMTGSLNSRPASHLLTIPAPSLIRKMMMIGKLFKAAASLGIKQLISNKVYEFCFRIIASSKTISKDE